MSDQSLLQAILPNWPVIGVVVIAFVLGKLGLTVLVLPILLWFLYDPHLFSLGNGIEPYLTLNSLIEL